MGINIVYKNKFGIVYFLGLLLLFAVLFGLIGALTIAGFIMLFILPFYLILSIFDFEVTEKIIFSIFLGIGIVSTLVYYLGLVISFRIAILIVWLTILFIGFLIWHLGSKKNFKLFLL